MEKCMRFYVMYSKDNKDVEFVNAENRLRMQSLALKGYKNIGTGEHEDIKALNRGVCSNMRGMYEFQVRQNMLLKKELERALMLLKEVHRISDLTPVTSVREQHEDLLFEQNDSVTPHPPQAVPLPLKGKASFGFGHLIKDFWEDVN